MKLTPQMQGVLERIHRAARPPFYTLTPVAARAAYLAGSEILDLPRAALPRVENLQVPARDGHALAARLYAPSLDTGLPVLLYLHGGGFTIGSVDTHDSLCRQLALLSGAAVLSLDYRLAPEWRFPVAFEDTLDALHWLAAGAEALGLDGTRIAIGGDSAGGTLAAATAVHVARHGGPALALQLLFYPGCGELEGTASYHLYGNGYLLDVTTIDWFFEQTIDRHARHDPRFAPRCADEVEGAAPAWIGLAECDPLTDSAVAYGDQLRAAGVPVELEIWRGVVHDFIKMGRAIPEAGRAHAAAAQALRAAFSI
ncbi:alpha/beta hydrolase [Rivibacter subsaxonicus]|uniref:Acetyl esterase n=1 Tax=Rivibacter subsaxonicus TaxID=457575 RepID=A0A4Q7VA19_9BURK|nr:alpha/beta hydrolase [Rivibacter subsaxonicus]RZT93606.1 acetyl esterase [Rivibacter subsaxonicus]